MKNSIDPVKIRKGEHFLHPQHGIGRVRSVLERSFFGHSSASYVEIHFAMEDLTMTVLEKDFLDNFRRVVSPDQASELLDCLESWEGRPKGQWKARANAHQAAMESGDPFECVKVLKELSLLKSKESLRLADRRHYSRSFERLAEELACSLNKTRRQTRKIIQKALVVG